MFTRRVLLSAILVSLLVSQSPAVETIESRDKRMQWWREARFGMFVHWGLYSGLAGTWNGKPVGKRGGMEWIQQRVRADTGIYAERAIPLFKPTPGFAKEWSTLARKTGCRYLVFTTKHHDGFALHDSKASEYDAGSVLGRDLVREIADAARGDGLRVGFYHSVIDWHHDQYEYARSKQLPHPLKGKPYPNQARDHAKYVDYLHREVTELVSNYGRVDVMWWDYSSQDFQGDEAWRSFDLMTMVREKQPGIIMNNRLFRCAEAGWKSMGTHGFTGTLDPKYGDFITPEQHIPATGMPGIDWETCMTMNTTWGYSRHDHAWKPARTLIRNLVDIASKGGNYLLNIGPRADGSVPQESVELMATMGTWMSSYGDSIYGTTASLFPKLPWGRSTTKALPDGGTRLYLQVFEWPGDGVLVIPGLATAPARAELMSPDGVKALSAELQGTRVLLTVPGEPVDEDVSVIALTFEGKPVVTEPRLGAGKDGIFRLKAADAILKGGKLGLETKADHTRNIGFWTDSKSTVTFKIHVEKPGMYTVELAHACPPDAGGTAVLTACESELRFELPSTGDWAKFGNCAAGRIALDTAGPCDLVLKADVIKGIALMNLREIVLRPAR
jgi:alpha-L-fucosidase